MKLQSRLSIFILVILLTVAATAGCYYFLVKPSLVPTSDSSVSTPSSVPIGVLDSGWRWHSPPHPFAGNKNITNFPTAKMVIFQIQRAHPRTIYCDCVYVGKVIQTESCGYRIQKDQMRALRLEWEHVVPAENFGRSFQEWREGSRACTRNGRAFKGRKCAEQNLSFNQIEGDMYNLWPEDGELNALRNDFSMAELNTSQYDFGRCNAKITDRKFEPEPKARGIVARVYFYMEGAYPGHGILSQKNIKLFEAWDREFPVQQWECRRTRIIEDVQGNENPIVKPRCVRAGLWPKQITRQEKIPPPRLFPRRGASRAGTRKA